MAQDRTDEFRAAVRARNRIVGGSSRSKENLQPPASRSEFMVRASAIMKDISSTTDLLRKLTALARRRAVFDDRPAEITELSTIIKQRMSSIKQAIQGLESVPHGGSGWTAKSTQVQLDQHSKNVMVSLQGRLQEITGSFAEVLEERSRNMQASRTRADQYLAPAATPERPESRENPLYQVNQQSSQALADELYSENPYATPAPTDDEVLMLPQEQSVALLQDQQGSYLNSRSTAVDAIESTINELGQMFGQLSTMIAEQRDVVQRIDANTDDIALNVSGAHRELLKYYARVSSNRWLMLKSFGVILFFFFIWVIIS